MKFIKTILAAVALVAAFNVALPEAKAQTTVNPIMNGGTNNVAVNSTNTYTAGALCIAEGAASQFTAIQISYAFHVAPVGDSPSVTFTLKRSLDNSNWENTAFHTLLATGNTNTTIWITNLAPCSVPYLCVSEIRNTNSAVITNITVKAASKPGI